MVQVRLTEIISKLKLNSKREYPRQASSNSKFFSPDTSSIKTTDIIYNLAFILSTSLSCFFRSLLCLSFVAFYCFEQSLCLWVSLEMPTNWFNQLIENFGYGRF